MDSMTFRNGRALCPLCGGSGSPHFRTTEHLFFKCAACGSGFIDPVPTDTFLSEYYSRFHRQYDVGGGYEQWEGRMSADFPAKVAQIRRLSKLEDFTLLDVGCGKGYFVKACRDAGIDAQGIDLSDTAIEYATKSLGVPASCGKIEDIGEGLGRFDVVTFWATIEHLPRPIETLAAIRKALKPGGLLFLDTGIADDALDRLLPGATQWYDPPQHLFVFSEEGLRAALSAAGLTPVYVDRCFERSALRRVLRNTRAIGAALGLRAVSAMFRVRCNEPFGFVRFPLGNLIFCACEARDEPR